MSLIDEVLQRVGLKYEDLTSSERDTLTMWSQALQSKRLTVEEIRAYIKSMRSDVERELTSGDDANTSWLSVFTLLFPLYGLIRKWYQDKKIYGLHARLKNYMLLESLLDTPDRAKQAIDQAVAGLVSNTKRK